LKDYATSKKDMKKGVEIVPEENYRLRNEDMFSADQLKFGSKQASKSNSVVSESTTTSTTVESYMKDLPDGYSEQHGFREAS